MTVPQFAHWTALVSCLILIWRVPLPWLKVYLLLAVGEVFYRASASTPWCTVWLTLLLLARLAVCLECYSLLTVDPPWRWGSAAYWPLVFLAGGLTLCVVGATEHAGTVLYARRYIQIWMAVWFLLTLAFVGSYGTLKGWKRNYAALLCSLTVCQAAASSLWLTGIDLHTWRKWDRLLYLATAGLWLAVAYVLRHAKAGARTLPTGA